MLDASNGSEGPFDRAWGIGKWNEQFHLVFKRDKKAIILSSSIDFTADVPDLPFSYSWLDFQDPLTISVRESLNILMHKRERSDTTLLIVENLDFAFDEAIVYGLTYTGKFDELLFDGDVDEDLIDYPELDVDMDNFLVAHNQLLKFSMMLSNDGIHFSRGVPQVEIDIYPYRFPYDVRHRYSSGR
jgi:hypothetical protein